MRPRVDAAVMLCAPNALPVLPVELTVSRPGLLLARKEAPTGLSCRRANLPRLQPFTPSGQASRNARHVSPENFFSGCVKDPSRGGAKIHDDFQELGRVPTGRGVGVSCDRLLGQI